MARKTLGYSELQWTCPNCNGINKGTQQDCENCGAPQPDDVKFEQAKGVEVSQEEKLKKRAKAGADIHCPYCGTRNPGDAEICVACGGDISEGERRKSGEVLGAYKKEEIKNIPCPHCGAENPENARSCAECGGSMQMRKEKPSRTAAPAKESEEKKRPPIALLAIFVAICCIGVVLIYFLFFKTDAQSGTVTGLHWERTVTIEGLMPVEYENWADQIPSEAEVQGCKSAVRSIESAPPSAAKFDEVCGTPYTVDTGTGVGEVVQDCEYHVYDDRCTYTVIEWAPVDSVTLSGSDLDAEWPDPVLTTDQRLGAGSEYYEIFFDSNGNAYTYTTEDYDYFQQFDIGSTWTLEINTLGGVQSVSR